MSDYSNLTLDQLSAMLESRKKSMESSGTFSPDQQGIYSQLRFRIDRNKAAPTTGMPGWSPQADAQMTSPFAPSSWAPDKGSFVSGGKAALQALPAMGANMLRSPRFHFLPLQMPGLNRFEQPFKDAAAGALDWVGEQLPQPDPNRPVANAIGSLAPVVGATALAGPGAAVPMAAAFGVEAHGRLYTEALHAGFTPQQADLAALPGAAGAAAMGLVGMKAPMGGNWLARSLVKGGEGAALAGGAGALEDLTAKGTYDHDRDVSLGAIAQRHGASMVAGGVGAGLGHAVGEVGESRLRQAAADAKTEADLNVQREAQKAADATKEEADTKQAIDLQVGQMSSPDELAKFVEDHPEQSGNPYFQERVTAKQQEFQEAQGREHRLEVEEVHPAVRLVRIQKALQDPSIPADVRASLEAEAESLQQAEAQKTQDLVPPPEIVPANPDEPFPQPGRLAREEIPGGLVDGLPVEGELVREPQPPKPEIRFQPDVPLDESAGAGTREAAEFQRRVDERVRQQAAQDHAARQEVDAVMDDEVASRERGMREAAREQRRAARREAVDVGLESEKAKAESVEEHRKALEPFHSVYLERLLKTSEDGYEREAIKKILERRADEDALRNPKNGGQPETQLATVTKGLKGAEPYNLEGRALPAPEAEVFEHNAPPESAAAEPSPSASAPPDAAGVPPTPPATPPAAARPGDRLIAEGKSGLKNSPKGGGGRRGGQRGETTIYHDVYNYSLIAAGHILNGLDFAATKAKMIAEHGEYVRQQFARIWALAQSHAQEGRTAKTEGMDAESLKAAPEVEKPAKPVSVAKTEAEAAPQPEKPKPTTTPERSITMEPGQSFKIVHGFSGEKDARYVKLGEDGKHHYEYKSAKTGEWVPESRGDEAFGRATILSTPEARAAHERATASKDASPDATVASVRRLPPPPPPPTEPPGGGGAWEANDPNVEKSLRASRGVMSQSFLSKVKDTIAHQWHRHTREFVSLHSTKDSPEAQDALSVFKRAAPYGQAKALRVIRDITKGMKRDQELLFERVLFARDLSRSIDEGLYKGKELPFEFEDTKAVQTQLATWEKAAKEDPLVAGAIAARGEILRQIAKDRVVAGLANPQDVQNPDSYFHRQVLEYKNLTRPGAPLARGSKGARIGKFGFQQERVGSSKEHNTAYVESEFEWLSQHYRQMAEREALARIEKSGIDIYPRLKMEANEKSKARRLKLKGAIEGARQEAKGSGAEAKLKAEAKIEKLKKESEEASIAWEDLVPKGHKIVQIGSVKHGQAGTTLADSIITKIIEHKATAEDIEAIKKLHASQKPIVVPDRWAETLGKLHEDPLPGGAWRLLNTLFKAQALVRPDRLVPGELKNFFGDQDAAFAFSRGTSGGTPKALKDYWDYLRGNGSDALKREIEEEGLKTGVLGSGFSASELPDVSEHFRQFQENPKFHGFSPKEPSTWLKLPQAAVVSYFGNAWNFRNFFENGTRLAAYREMKRLVQSGKNVYGASKREQIDAIKDPTARAAKLARELLGDYGAVTEAGTKYRQGAAPFYSWLEINAPRYARLMKNAPHEGLAEGKSPSAASHVTSRASTLLKMSAFTAAMMVYNRAMFGDVVDDIERQAGGGLIASVDKNGKATVIPLQGAWADAIDWFNTADFSSDVKDVRAGKATVGDKLAEAAKGPPERILGSVYPVQKAIGEAALKRKLGFKDALGEGTDIELSRQPVRDSGEHVARTFGVDWLYDKVTGKPSTPVTEMLKKSSALKTIDTGEIAYYHAKDMAREFKEKRAPEKDKGGGGPPDSDKGKDALFYYRTAKKLGNNEMAEKWKARYMEMGGKPAGLQASIRYAQNPLEGLPKKYRQEFMNSLTPAEKAEVTKALAWAQRTYK